MTLREALAHLQGKGLDRIDAQMLLLLALGRGAHERAWLMAHDGDALDASTTARLDALAQRRADGEPMAYLRGDQEFFGLTLQVDARVLVPRSDTETLVSWAIARFDHFPGPTRVLDLGTGSGAIALAIKAQRPAACVFATDASDGALCVARRNAGRLGLAVDFLPGHWIAAVPGQRFHIIASNPPYIAEGDIHLAALGHEPVSALTAGADGLAGTWPRPGAGGSRTVARGRVRAGGQPRRPGGHCALQRRPMATTAIMRVVPGPDLGPLAQGLSAMSDAQTRIDQLVKSHDIVLFMKGNASFPMCGFSGRAIQILKACGVEPRTLTTVNVLEDDGIRQGIKEYSNWPTIPQLYVKGEFVGGSDIMMEMYQSGELQQVISGQA